MEDLYELLLSNFVFRENGCSESRTLRRDVNDTSPVCSEIFTGTGGGAVG